MNFLVFIFIGSLDARVWKWIVVAPRLREGHETLQDSSKGVENQRRSASIPEKRVSAFGKAN